MAVRKLSGPEEILELHKLMSICFLSEMDVETVKTKIINSKEQDEPAWGCFNDSGILVAGLINHQFRMYYDGYEVEAGGVGGVVSRPENRRSGAVREIFSELLQDARKRGEVFSGLYPFSHEFYRKWGYELCQQESIYLFPTAALHRYRHDGGVRMLLEDDSRDELLALYRCFAGRYNTAIVRDADSMKHRTPADPYAKNDYVYLLDDGRNPVAYAAFTKDVEESDSPVLSVKDYAFIGRTGLYSLMGFLGRMSAQFKKVRMVFPGDIPLPALIDDPYTVEISTRMSYMIRVINVSEALRLMKKPENCVFTIAVRDDLLSDNACTYRVESDCITSSNTETPDISMDVRTLAQAVLGYTDLAGLQLRADVEVSDNLRILEQVFNTKPLYIADYY